MKILLLGDFSSLHKYLKDGPNLRTKPEWLVPLKEAGFNLVGLANNHMGDYGEEGINDSIENCEKIGLSTVGAGRNLKDAQKVFYCEKNNVKVAIVAVCEHEYGIAEEKKSGTAPLDTIDNIKQINEAKNNADFVIISIHGGNEYFPYPRPYLRKQCKFYIEQGCDAVVCHHPHIPGAYEIYNGKPVFYSLGNYLFDNLNPTDRWNEGYMVRLEISSNTLDDTNQNQISFELIPYTQSFKQGGIKLMNSTEKENFLNRIEDYKNILNSKSEYEKVWKDFCKSKKDSHLILQYSPLTLRGVGRLLRIFGITELLLKNTKRLAGRLNFIRCESHREVLLEILKENLFKVNKK